MEFNQWGPIAIQIPVVVTFVIFTTWMLKAFLIHLDKVAENHAKLIELERKQRSEAMQLGLREVSQLCQAMEKLAQAVADNTKSITIHNSESVVRHHTLLDTLGKPRP